MTIGRVGKVTMVIKFPSAVHMPFENAVLYIILYGTAECNFICFNITSGYHVGPLYTNAK